MLAPQAFADILSKIPPGCLLDCELHEVEDLFVPVAASFSSA